MIRRIIQRLRVLIAWRSRATLPQPAFTPARPPQPTVPLSEALLAACHDTSTDDLLRTWDEGHALGGVLPDLLDAVGTVLREHGIAVCPCGASPNRPHTPTCKET